MTSATEAIAAEDFHALALAYEALEHPGYAARLSSLLGVPLGQVAKWLPPSWHDRVENAARGAIAQATGVALRSIETTSEHRSLFRRHRLLAIGSGAVGGYFGLPGLLIELPVTTILMLRAIADIARSQGEDLTSPETRLACVAVFALGGRTHEDDYTEIGYYEVRAALALHFSSVIERIASQGAKRASLPASVEIIRVIASRFGVVVSDKAAAQLVPAVGAASGALVNGIFMQHFQAVAGGHFTLRRLERKYGSEVVEAAYAAMASDERTSTSRAEAGAASA